jgi:hypothetical protein
MTVEAVISAIHEQGPRWADRSAVGDESGSIATETAAEIQSLEAHRMLQPADFGGEQASIEAHMHVVAAVDHASWNVTSLRGSGSKDFVIDTPLRVPARRYFRSAHAMARQAPGQLGKGRGLYRVPFRAIATIVLAAP